MLKRVLVLALFVWCDVHADSHPVFYIDKGACPFECCTYREWRTEKTTTLYAEPGTNSRAVGIVEIGTLVTAQTGEVHTRPGKIVVKRDVIGFKKDDVLWVYTYLGEGYFKIWHQGEFIEDQIDFNYRSPSPEDWGSFEIMPTSVWWIKARMPSGVEGWTNEPENFTDKDACG